MQAKYIKNEKVRSFLIFFYITLIGLGGCTEKRQPIKITTQWQNGKVVSIHLKESENMKDLQVFVIGESQTAVMGQWERLGDSQKFTPIVPFSMAQTYEVKKEGKTLGQFTIPQRSASNEAKILHMYPVQDSVPQNLLKIYVQFSEPMQNVGDALRHISVFNETEEKEVPVFLPLETELWNREHDRLTLWLDPGRIKTDLIPNRELGMPLQVGHTYTIRFKNSWKTADGRSLQPYGKKWYVTHRDATKPQVDKWKVLAPPSNSKGALSIEFEEPLDFVLAQESLHIENRAGIDIPGIWEISDDGSKAEFTPENSWISGTYRLVVNAKLEDLAGNNLNRLFDENMETQSKRRTYKDTFKRDFVVQ